MHIVFIPTKNGTLTIDAADRHHYDNHVWTQKSRNTHIYRCDKYNNTHYLHRQIMNADGGAVDHANGELLDNTRQNLRKCSSFQNNCNRVKGVSSSKYKGVRFHKAAGRGGAAIKADRKLDKWLGLFDTQEQAAEAYDNAARVYHKQYGCYNFPKLGERSALHGKIILVEKGEI